jgi:hypothetical protein
MRLYKTTIVIWSRYDSDKAELVDLAREATNGDAYCSRQESVAIERPRDDPEWDDTEFFGATENDPDDEPPRITLFRQYIAQRRSNIPHEAGAGVPLDDDDLAVVEALIAALPDYPPDTVREALESWSPE